MNFKQPRLYLFLGFFVVLIVLPLLIIRSGGPWEVELDNRETTLALTFQDQSGKRRRTIILDHVAVGELAPRTYRLPDEVSQIDGAQLRFSDTTVLPGRVRFLLHGHTFDVMGHTLIIDGEGHSWTTPDELHLAPADQPPKPSQSVTP